MRQPLRHNNTPVLRNPVVLGGQAAIGIALVVVVAVVALSARGSNGDKSASIAPGATKRAAVTPTHATEISGLSGTATATINVRSGPGNDYSATGVLRRGADVSIVGKSDDGGWVEIQYPAHSTLHGWVMASSLEVHGDLAAAPIATPETLPMAVVPTYEAVATEPPLLTPDITVTPTSTPGAALPDLVISGSLISEGVLVVTVTNQGAGDLPATAIEVAVFDSAGAKNLHSTTLAVQGLKPGASIDVKTGYVPFSGPSQVLVIVDPNGKIPESDDTNNQLSVTFSPGSTATATTTAAATETPHP